MSVPLLPSECVSVIAGYLDYRDRANLEMVSHIWRLGSMYSHYKTKVFDSKDTIIWGEYKDKSVQVTNKMLQWLLKRCGNKLVTIKLEDIANTKSLTPEVIKMIAEYCPNIQNLHIDGIKLKPDAVLQVAMNVSRLRSLSVGPWENSSYPRDQDRALAVLLRNNVLLESLKITGYAEEDEFTDPSPLVINEEVLLGKCFSDITVTLRHLDVSDCEGMNKVLLGKAIRQFRQLESLKIQKCSATYKDVLSPLVENNALHSTLTTLRFYKTYFRSNFVSVDKGIKILQCYNNVTTLQISFCDWVMNDTIMGLGEYMTQIENLDISGCFFQYFQFALDPLVKLTKLKSLAMSGVCPDVGTGFLKSLSTSLRYLECMDNTGVTDESICDLLWNVHSLEYLNVAGCSNLTRRVVDTVHELRKTPRRIPLDIYLYGTKLYPHKEDQMDSMDSNIRIHYEPKTTSDYFDSDYFKSYYLKRSP